MNYNQFFIRVTIKFILLLVYIMKPYTFIFVIFIVSLVADITLNDLSRKPLSRYVTSPIILALRPYFDEKSILVAGVFAGLTIISALLVSMLLSKYLQKTLVTRDWKELSIFMAISFPIGYLFDVLIAKLNIFGDSLIPYYKTTAPGMWGAIAFEVAIIIGFLIQKYLIPKL